MEYKHKQKISNRFKSPAYDEKIIVLEIPDEYAYMNAELIETIKTSVSPYLNTEAG